MNYITVQCFAGKSIVCLDVIMEVSEERGLAPFRNGLEEHD